MFKYNFFISQISNNILSDVADLLSLVLQVGQEVETSSKMMDTISEVVKRGIETAQTDLERENAEKLWQEGILRHVPVVGTFVNWWNPISKETGVRGRSLNLQAGNKYNPYIIFS